MEVFCKRIKDYKLLAFLLKSTITDVEYGRKHVSEWCQADVQGPRKIISLQFQKFSRETDALRSFFRKVVGSEKSGKFLYSFYKTL